jgi:hypothetical protein
MIQFESYTLDNGLKVLLHHDERRTVVTVNALGEVRVTEQCWGPEGKKEGTRHFCWQRSA